MHCFFVTQVTPFTDVLLQPNWDLLNTLFIIASWMYSKCYNIFGYTSHLLTDSRNFATHDVTSTTHDATCAKKSAAFGLFLLHLSDSTFYEKAFFATCDVTYTWTNCYLQNVSSI